MLTVSKGISPLIAAVLLVAFTMSIAGIMAAWATTYTTSRLSETGCALSMRITDLKFTNPLPTNGQIIVHVANENTNLNLTDLRYALIYLDPTKNVENAVLKTYSAGVDPLEPNERRTVIINATDPTEPVSIEVVAGNCLRVPVKVKFADFK